MRKEIEELYSKWDPNKIELFMRIFNTNERIEKYTTEMLTAYNLTYEESKLLDTICYVDKITINQLAILIKKPISNVSRTVKSLVDKNFIYLETDSIDKRQKYIEIKDFNIITEMNELSLKFVNDLLNISQTKIDKIISILNEDDN